MKKTDEFDRFDAAMKKVISISHDELKRREKEWRKGRRAKKRVKT